MARYEVITSPGLQYPVGAVIETDNLHKSMEQHVRNLDRKTREAPAEPVGVPDSREEDPVKAFNAATKIEKALAARASTKGDSENT